MESTKLIVLISSFCLLILLSILGFVLHRRKKVRKSIIQKGLLTQGKVVKFDQKVFGKGNLINRSVIHFKTPSGIIQEIVHLSPASKRSWLLDEVVELYYDPEKPDQFVIKGDKQSTTAVVIILLIAMVFYLFLMITFLSYS